VTPNAKSTGLPFDSGSDTNNAGCGRSGSPEGSASQGGGMMIRFVDLRGQGTGYRFAFWDTTRDSFCTFAGEQAWEARKDFAEAFALSGGKFADAVRVSGIE